MSKTGSLNIIKRVTEIRLGVISTDNLSESFEIWLDEWHLKDSKGYFDKALFTEGVVGYNGAILSVYDFPILKDPGFIIGYERKEGAFNEAYNQYNNRYNFEIEMGILNYLFSNVSYNKQDWGLLRNEDDLNTDGWEKNYFHRFQLNLKKSYLPAIGHSYRRTVKSSAKIELTKDDFRYQKIKEYDESIGFDEKLDLPFGISNSYIFSRNFLYTGELEGTTNSLSQKATLNQINDVTLSHVNSGNSISTYFKRDKNYTGSYLPYSEDGLKSYTYKLSAIFNPPGSSLEDAVISSITDSFGFDVYRPLKNRLGFNFYLDSSFSGMNFQFNEKYRDVITDNKIGMSIPFYIFKNHNIQVTLSMEREITSDYKRVLKGEDENEILVKAYKYLLMPPFYYINLVKGIGRIKDYDAVDIYKYSNNIIGNTTNTIYNRYTLDTAFQYDKWYVPSAICLYLGGETNREGESYTQKRNLGINLNKYIFFSNGNDFFEKSLYILLDYNSEKNFLNKVLTQNYGFKTEFMRLREENRGIKLINNFSYQRGRQKIDNKNYLLIPENPQAEPEISEKPDKDKIESNISFHYLWVFNMKRGFKIPLAAVNLSSVSSLRNEDILTIENIYTFTDREKSESFSNIPIRITFQHNSDYDIKEYVSAGFYFKAIGGIEERVVPPSIKGNILPSMGLEFGINIKIIF